jgi:hypothetical protein
VGDKNGKQKPSGIQFFALADGKHIIAGDEIIPFGEHPYAEYRAQLQQKADGPYRGSASKDLELVEFADFQCPHCKDAQANMEKLVADFPKARIVFENYLSILRLPARLPTAFAWPSRAAATPSSSSRRPSLKARTGWLPRMAPRSP